MLQHREEAFRGAAEGREVNSLGNSTKAPSDLANQVPGASAQVPGIVGCKVTPMGIVL